MPPGDPPLTIGRYKLARPIASGGMATIFLAIQGGGAGFSRVVAIKRLHQHYANEPEFISMFLDEAKLAARIRHPNVVQTLDVVHEGNETLIVLEYVDGETVSMLAKTMREKSARVPLDLVVTMMVDTCRGLHAAHEARTVDGKPLGIVHRDVSPQNLIVGADGVTRVTDFGIALANERLSHTRAGEVKGKPAYMAPEQITSDAVSRQSDLYAVALIMWELCSGRRAFDASNQGALLARVMTGAIPRLSEVAPWVPPPVVAVIERGLSRDPKARFATGKEMAAAILDAMAPATPQAVSAFLEHVAKDALAERRAAALELDRGEVGLARRTMRGQALTKDVLGEVTAPSSRRPVVAPAATNPPPRIEPLPPRSEDVHTLTGHSPLPAGKAAPAFIAGALVFFAAIGVAGAWMVWNKTSGQPKSASATELSAPDPTTTSSASAAPLAAGTLPTASAPTASAPTSSAVEPALSASATATPVDPVASGAVVASASSAPPVSGRMRAPSATPAATSTPSDPTPRPCDPPYYVDANGIRRVKRNCL